MAWSPFFQSGVSLNHAIDAANSNLPQSRRKQVLLAQQQSRAANRPPTHGAGAGSGAGAGPGASSAAALPPHALSAAERIAAGDRAYSSAPASPLAPAAQSPSGAPIASANGASGGGGVLKKTNTQPHLLPPPATAATPTNATTASIPYAPSAPQAVPTPQSATNADRGGFFNVMRRAFRDLMGSSPPSSMSSADFDRIHPIWILGREYGPNQFPVPTVAAATATAASNSAPNSTAAAATSATGSLRAMAATGATTTATTPVSGGDGAFVKVDYPPPLPRAASGVATIPTSPVLLTTTITAPPPVPAPATTPPPLPTSASIISILSMTTAAPEASTTSLPAPIAGSKLQPNELEALLAIDPTAAVASASVLSASTATITDTSSIVLVPALTATAPSPSPTSSLRRSSPPLAAAAGGAGPTAASTPTPTASSTAGNAGAAGARLTPLYEDIFSRIWVTYRKQFPALPGGGTNYTNDGGWGCMLRSAQMLMANALLIHYRSREWTLDWSVNTTVTTTHRPSSRQPSPSSKQHSPSQLHASADTRSISGVTLNPVLSCNDPVYTAVIRWFLDYPAPYPVMPYSLHNLLLAGTGVYAKKPGDWYGPNESIRMMQKCLTLHGLSSAPVMFVSDDQTLYLDKIMKLCTVEEKAPKPLTTTPAKPPSSSAAAAAAVSGDWSAGMVDSKTESEWLAFNKQLDATASTSSGTGGWRSLLLIIPVRLGIDKLNPAYIPSLLQCFHLPQSLGVIGGRPRQSLYFIGHQTDERVFYLDPHTVQKTLPLNHNISADCTSYHCSTIQSMNAHAIDPSLAIAFYCRNYDDFKQFWSAAKHLTNTKFPLFSLADVSPNYGALDALAASDDDASAGGASGSGGDDMPLDGDEPVPIDPPTDDDLSAAPVDCKSATPKHTASGGRSKPKAKSKPKPKKPSAAAPKRGGASGAAFASTASSVNKKRGAGAGGAGPAGSTRAAFGDYVDDFGDAADFAGSDDEWSVV